MATLAQISNAVHDLHEAIRARTARVCVVGMGYVGLPLARAFLDAGFPVLGYDIDDARESPAFPIMQELLEAGADVCFHDPFFERLPEKRDFDMDVPSVALTEETLAAQDCVVIVTAHSSYAFDWIVEHAPLVVDTRGATRHLGNVRLA